MGTRQIKSYHVQNPAAGNIVVDTSGTALSNTNQPTLNKGRATNLGTSASSPSVNMTRVDMGARLQGNPGRTVFGTKVIVSARQGVQGTGVTGSNSATVANNGGLCRYTDASHGLSVGDSVVVTDTNGIVSGPQRVTAVPNANTFDTDKKFASGTGSITWGTVTNRVAGQEVRNFLARRLSSATLQGASSTLLRSGASDYGIRRSIHKVEGGLGRTTKTATAIRAGNWNEYSGVWTTKPTVANDSIGDVSGSTVTDGTADHAATPTRAIPGELVYREGGKQKVGTSSGSGVHQDDYKAKTG